MLALKKLNKIYECFYQVVLFVARKMQGSIKIKKH